jgi:hypothetical protein
MNRVASSMKTIKDMIDLSPIPSGFAYNSCKSVRHMKSVNLGYSASDVMFAAVVIVERGDTSDDTLHYTEVVFHSKRIL